MTLSLTNSTSDRLAVAAVITSGVVALGVAMGIGRFAFTPMMPLMIRDGAITPLVGAEWAAANYVGYFLGALSAAWLFRNARHGLLASLVGVTATTLAGAAVDAGSPTLLGPALRAASGVFSAWAMICASAWCLAELARLRVEHLGAWIYTGVGLGIALAGSLTWLAGWQNSASVWLELGAVAGAGAAFVFASSGGRSTSPAMSKGHGAPVAAPSEGPERAPIIVCYGVFGFGYIVPATFLPAMARELAPDPLVFGITWPLFGLAAAGSVAAAASWLAGKSRKRLWAAAQGVMAVGVALPLAAQTLSAVAASAVLVGGTFMIATMAGLQLAREAQPENPTPLLAKMTSSFAAGQIAGPILVRALGDARWGGWDGAGLVGAIAAVLLLLTAAWLWLSPERLPVHSYIRTAE